MDATVIDDILARLVAGAANDDELLECARVFFEIALYRDDTDLRHG